MYMKTPLEPGVQYIWVKSLNDVQFSISTTLQPSNMQNIVKNCLIVIILVSLDRKQFGLSENIYFWYPFPTFLVAWGRQTPTNG